MVMPSKELQKAIKQFRALKDEDLTCPSASLDQCQVFDSIPLGRIPRQYRHQHGGQGRADGSTRLNAMRLAMRTPPARPRGMRRPIPTSMTASRSASWKATKPPRWSRWRP
jgi:hypothetical protein